MEMLDSPFFELSPVAMWLEDYSEVKKQFDLWREQGIQDLSAFLREDESRILACARKIKLLRVNSKTLELYQAENFEALNENLHLVFKEDMSGTHIKELVSLWKGETQFSHPAVNYTLTGQRIDIQLKGVVLPQHEHDLSLVLITTEDITAYTEACRLEEKSRHLAEARFIYSPTSLWVEDFSRIKIKLDELRALGIEDFSTFLDVHNDFVNDCIKDILILDVNQATLNLFGAPNKQTLLKIFIKYLRKKCFKPFESN